MNRPLRSGHNEFAEDARGLVVLTHGLAVALQTISTKKSAFSYLQTCSINLVSPHSFTHQQIRVRLVVSSQFDRRLFRSRVHSIETKGQIEAKVSIEEQMKKTETQCICRLFFVLLSTAKLNIFKQI